MIKKLKIPLLFLLVLLILPLVSALTVTDTTFHSSVSNYTIYIDSITLDNVTVTNQTIEFYSLTSVGSNFINVNETYDARADFYGLGIGLIVRNINTSTDLFTSVAGSQDYNATFTPGQVLMIMIEEEEVCAIDSILPVSTIFLIIMMIMIFKFVLPSFNVKKLKFSLEHVVLILIGLIVLLMVSSSIVSLIMC